MFRISSPLVTRMLASVASLALLIFLIVGAAELQREHEALTRDARSHSDSALALSQGPMANALWNFDGSALDMLARNLVREGTLVHVQVRSDTGDLLVNVWRDDQQRDGLPSRLLPLTVAGRSAPIGQLLVHESYEAVDAEIRRRAVDRLPVELLKIVAIALSILLLLHRRVIGRLSILVRQLGSLPLNDPHARVTVPDTDASEREPDEIAVLAGAVNRFQRERALEVQRRSEAESQLRDTLVERSVILGALRDGVLALDAQHRVRYANEAAARLIGLAERPAPGTALGSLPAVQIHGQRVDLGPWLIQLCQPEGPHSATLHGLTPGGCQGALQAQATPISGAHEVAWMVMLSDVSDALRSQRAEQARAAAEAANQAKSEFLSRMSHELRTPLNAIVGFAQTLESDPVVQSNAQRKEWVHLIERAGWHLSHMIADVLDLSRIEAGNLRLDRQAVDLGQLVTDTLAYVSADAEREHIRCMADVAPEARWLQTDAVRIQQVLLNLISNAVKYNQPEGLVRVQVALDEREPTWVQISVEDTGLGLDPAQQAALFQSFNRLGREGSGKPGTGIGLVITRGLVALMAGELEVHSQPGLGSRFTVRLPGVCTAPQAQPNPVGHHAATATIATVATSVAASGAAATAQTRTAGPGGSATTNPPANIAPSSTTAASTHSAAAAPLTPPLTPPITSAPPGSPGKPGYSCRLLYIEDDPVNALVMGALVGQRPELSLSVAATMAEGLSAIAREAPDLVLLDMQLPDGRGTELLLTLRADARWRSLPVIMVSADAMDGSVREALAAGANAYITKPLDFDQLLKQIEQQLAASH